MGPHSQHTESNPDQWLSRECNLSLDPDGTEVDGVNGRGDEEHPRPHYSWARSSTCRRRSGKTCLSIDDNNALGIGSSEKPRGVARRGRGMNVLFCPGPRQFQVWAQLGSGSQCNKARWDLNETNKSGCYFTPAWLQPDFRLTTQKKNSFNPEHRPLLPFHIRKIRETNSCILNLKRNKTLWMFVGPELRGISRRHERRG